MDEPASIGTIKIEKLNDDNYHTWKHRIQFALSLRDLDEYLTAEPPASEHSTFASWKKNDKKAKAMIALSLQDDHLEQVQHATSAKEIWNLISDIFEKHTLLNKLTARRQFYTAKMRETEKVRSFATRIRQLASSLKSMGVKVKDDEMAMTLLCGVPSRFDNLISALDAVVDDKEKFTFEFVLSRLEQEERRHANRLEEEQIKEEEAALVATLHHKALCKRCGKHPESQKCYWEYPELAPEWHPARNKSNGQNEDSTPEVEQPDEKALFPQCQGGEEHFCLAAIEGKEEQGSEDWIVDSAATCHIVSNKSLLSNYRRTPRRTLNLGGIASTSIVGVGDVWLNVRTSSGTKKTFIRDVQYSPKLGYNILSVSTCTERGTRVVFEKSKVSILSNEDGALLSEGVLYNGLYRLKTVQKFRKYNFSLKTQDIKSSESNVKSANSKPTRKAQNQGVVCSGQSNFTLTQLSPALKSNHQPLFKTKLCSYKEALLRTENNQLSKKKWTLLKKAGHQFNK